MAKMAIYLDAGNTPKAKDVEEICSLAAQSDLRPEDVLYLAFRCGLKAEDALSLAVRMGGPKAEEEIYARLFKLLQTSFSRARRKDPELYEWEYPRYSASERKKIDAKCPFLLFKMKASAKKAQVSWLQKKQARFNPERAGYTNALRVARVATGPDGLHLEQAGDGGQPGALSFHIDVTYMGRPWVDDVVFEEGSSVPLREVAVIKRLPGGDGISIMSCVGGLGVKLHDIVFMLHSYSITVALTFTERWFHVSSKFTEEPLYVRVGLDCIDITVLVENLIKKLYQMYEQEEREKNIMHAKQDHQDRETLMQQRKELMEEQERKKLEALRRSAESKKHKHMREEMKKAVHRAKEEARTREEGRCEEYDDTCFCTSIFQPVEESDWLKPSEVDCANEESCKDLPEETTTSIK